MTATEKGINFTTGPLKNQNIEKRFCMLRRGKISSDTMAISYQGGGTLLILGQKKEWMVPQKMSYQFVPLQGWCNHYTKAKKTYL